MKAFSLKSTPPLSMKCKGRISFAFLCLFSCMVVLYGTIEVCRVEVYSVSFAACARFILFVVVVLLVSL